MVGDKSKIRFFNDMWCGDHPLKETFLELFSIAHYKEAWLAEHAKFLIAIFNGIYHLKDQCMIGRWT